MTLPTPPISEFNEFELSSDLLSAVKNCAYQQPTLVQTQAIPAILLGKDVLAEAQTGSGKTAAYALPILEQLLRYRATPSEDQIRGNHIRYLILVPSRELANQVSQEFYQYSRDIMPKINIRSVYGGVEIEPQIKYLQQNTDILIATPQRILALAEKKAVQFNYLQSLVLDEVDRLIEDSFREPIEALFKLLPTQRQNLMFTATFPQQVRSLIRQVLYHPVVINIKQQSQEQIDQHVITTNPQDKVAVLYSLIQQYHWQPLLVFCSTKKACDQLATDLQQKGLNAVAIHGNKPQEERENRLMDFKHGKLAILIATDLAARGIDFINLPCVINYQLPRVPNDYLHRIGRTGRAGKAGLAISIISPLEYGHFNAIEKHLNITLEREQVKGFEVDEQAPIQPYKKSRKKAKKPLSKKRKQRQNNRKKQQKEGVALTNKQRENDIDPIAPSKKEKTSVWGQKNN